MADEADNDTGVVYGSLFVYAPNRWAPIVFAALYGLSAIGHLYQCFRYKAFKMIGLQPCCAALFALGYGLREYGAYNYSWQTGTPGEVNTPHLIVYILSQVFIFVAPPLLELSNYHVLGRIFYYVPYLSPFPPGKVLSTFGILMMIVETLNGLGVALASNPAGSSQGLGSNLVKAALGMQLALIVIFIVLAGVFHLRCKKAKIANRAISVPLWTLYTSMLLILARSVYRLIEHMDNTHIELDNLEALKSLTPVLRYEWYLYGFEATLMFLNSLLWNIWNPARFLPSDYRVYLARDGHTELRDDYEDDRSRLRKTGAFMTLGIFWGKRENRHFEQLHEYPMTDTYTPSTPSPQAHPTSFA